MMKGRGNLTAGIHILVLLLLLVSAQAFAVVDYPHFDINNIGCDSCHFIYGTEPTLLPPWTAHTPQNIDDTQHNTLCWSCHNDVDAPYVRTHSSLQIDDSYGDWTVECRVCHNPHYQKQKEYGSSSYIYSSTSTTVTATSITKTGAGWTEDEYEGMAVIPNISQNKYVYKITGNTSETLTVQGPMNLTKVVAGNTFGILYGNLINKAIDLSKITITPAKSGSKTTRFFRPTGSKSFADGDGTYDGVCEVCHTQTTHFRNNGSGSDQLHTNVGTPAGTNCTTCHSHVYGFRHGGGEGTGCDDCHGHDAGYGGATGGKGTYVAHSAHTENDSDDLRGPNVGCSTCHNTSSYPNFADGVSYANYKSGAQMTTVCNPCHSPDGTYNGVSDAAVGAKNNWSISASSSSRVYESDGSLKAGKDKWCATCHDESSSQIQSVNASNVVGDEDGSYTYGTGWGYYKTGHGLPASQKYPASGGVTAGAGKGCTDCHDSTLAHIDGEARTFGCGDGCNTTEYRQGYRLKLVGGQDPMVIPWPWSPTNDNSADKYRLCVSCHDSGPFVNSDNMNTNMRDESANRHAYHLNIKELEYPADYNYGSNNSQITCVTCHNVHGSTRFAMVRDGKLISREPGMQMWYINNDITKYYTFNPPEPQDLPLSYSTGRFFRGYTAANLCSHCHGGNYTNYRDPFQDVSQAPVLDWTGETGYQSDGADPETAASGSTFIFRVTYTDKNNDSPTYIEVWIDKDDSGTYEAGEKYSMTGADSGDTFYYDGKIYTRSISISRAGDNVISYRFYASDGLSDATGAPVSGGTITISGSAPVLSWTGEVNYTGDGVNPDSGGSGAAYQFRIMYSDTDNDAPSSVQIWVDADDNGAYDAGEKYDMDQVNSSDTIYTDGKLYTKSLSLSHAGDGILNYRFHASDGTADATGTPVSGSTVTISSSANNPPSLDWVAETCFTSGVKPASGPAGGDYEFKIRYTDPDNQCPPAASDIQVWIDMDDSGDYAAGEKYNLSEVDAGDTDCSDGKLYKATRTLSLAGDNSLNYRFYASDGTDTATGAPVFNNTVTVVNALKVRPGGGSGWYSSIQAAIDAVDGEHTVLVYPGSYNETLNFNCNSPSNDHNTTVRSVCGPDLTTLDGSGLSASVTSSWRCGGNTVDGFEITNAATGVSITEAGMTINNCRIHDNTTRGIYYKDDGSPKDLPLIVTNSEIYSHNSSASGAGVFIKNGSSPVHSFTNTLIRDNTTTGDGGGVYLDNYAYAEFVNSVIRDNTAGGAGAGIYIRASNSATFNKSRIINNTASGGGGGGAYMSADDTLDLTNSIVAGNKASNGGAIMIDGIVNITNSTITDNEATTGRGGAFNTNTFNTITVKNSIIWNNVATTDKTSHIAWLSGTTTMTASDSIFSNDGDTDFGDYPYITVDSATLTFSGLMLESAPLFVDSAGGDYHIKSISPAIDNANAAYAPADDIDGDSRPQGSADDIGADEYTADSHNAPVLSWTGETGYANDGVSPDIGAGGSSFEFRINYKDTDNDAPTSIQVWVDRDDSGIYEPGEKYNMQEVFVDAVYSDGKLYTKTLTLPYAGNGTINYRFYASDGKLDANGDPTGNKTLTITNSAPTLSWTGETNYTTDGVSPDSGVTGGSYEFRIDYADIDNTAPNYIEVWVDEDDSGTYDFGEKYSMTATDGGDGDYTDGKRYTKTLTLNYAGDGDLNYTFRASDGMDTATGSPTTDRTVTVTGAPVLEWTGEANYTGDGVNPDSGTSGSSFEFRIKYTDSGNTAPTSIQVWIDEDDSGTYEPGEKYDMTGVDPLDTTYTDGKLYTKTLSISTAGDGDMNYRFYASNGTEDAVGAPTSNSTVIINEPPALAWTGETNYVSDGVDPECAPEGSNYTFRVKYTDSDNDAPSVIQVWIDTNDSGTYESGEKYDMTVDGGDGNYANGEIYTKTLVLSAAGDGSLNYQFYARDASDNAVGTPTSNKDVTVNVLITLNVPSQYATIQAAINAAVSGNVIRVADGTYSENISFIGKNVTVQSVNGAVLTKIQGSGAANAVVSFISGESSCAVLDGFTIDNQRGAGADGRGVKITNSATPIIKNSIIEGNLLTTLSSGDSYWGGGIYINGGGVTVDNTIIGQNGSANTANRGSGIYAINGLDIAISNSTISYNSGRDHAGIHLENMSGSTTLINTNVIYNSANGYTVGGIYAISSALSITGGSVSNNSGTYGAGLRVENAPAITTINGVTINTNAAGGTIAGGIYSISSPLAISNGTTINNNTSRDGAGMYLTGNYSGFPAGTKTTIDNTTITGNSTGGGYPGGGIYSSTIPLEITNSNISSNMARAGSAIRLESVPLVTVISNTTINNNIADGNNTGGAIYSNSSPITFTGGTISGNTNGREGGGLYLTGNYSAFPAGTKTTITGTTINGNSSGAYVGGGIYTACSITINGNAAITNNTGSAGGGMYITGQADVTVLDSVTITGNTATSGNNGGGIYSTGSPLAISNSTISSNTATRQGAAIFITGAYATTNTITNSTINGNNGQTNYSGGAIYTDRALQVDRTYIQGNRGGNGAGIYSNTTLSITNSVLTGNVSDRGTNDGGALNVSASATITNSTIAGNYASRYGGGISGGGTITNSIFWGNTSGTSNPQINGSPAVTYSDVAGGFAGTGNINVDPSFVNYQQASSGNPTSAGNFHIQSGSPVVNQGTASGAPSDDIDGDSRPLGGGIDMGADEKE